MERRWLLPRHERDPGFRKVILDLNGRGMFAAGAISLLATLAWVATYFFFMDKVPVWRYGGDPKTTIVMLDKLLIVVLGMLCLVLSRVRFARRWGRPTVAVLAFVIGLSMLLDDIAHGSPAFSASFLALPMLVAASTMPYSPWQTLLFCLTILTGYIVCLELSPIEFSSRSSGLLFLGTVVIIATGVSALLYKTRFETYRAVSRLASQTRALAAAKQRTEEQAQQLREMEQLKERFFANVSHEFRTPLTLLLGPVQDALDGAFGPLSTSLRRQLGVMRRNGLRLQQLIDELLDLSKLEAGRLRLHPEQRDLIPYLRRIVQSFSSLAEHKHITLTFTTGVDALPLRFDAEQLDKVFINLLSNAFKFTPDGGRIRVNVRVLEGAPPEQVEIGVRDTGPGIPASELPYVFDRFHQVEGAATGVQRGTGIGLALARELVELHGGTLHVESEEGFGSHFFVHLPQQVSPSRPEATPPSDRALRPPAPLLEAYALDPVAGADAAEVAPNGPAPETAPLVLLVDDNDDVRAYLRDRLQGRYRIAEATNGIEGLEAARSRKPDLMISDLMMPGLDGYALCRAVKTDPQLSHIPVILLSASASEASKIEGLETGADDYIFKPFSTAELLARVENLIELRQLLRARYSQAVVLEPSQISVPSADAAFLDQVRTVVEAHLGDCNFGVEWLAGEMALSARQLQRRLRPLTRLSAAGFIRMMRLKRAAQLLEQRAGSVAEVAYAVGFHDANYFSKLFRQTFGVPPSEYAVNRTSAGE